MRLVVLPGDGIGPEITAATTEVLRAASKRFELDIQIEERPVGHISLRQFGATVRPDLLEIVRAADGLILGPTATFDFKNEQRGEINPKLKKDQVALHLQQTFLGTLLLWSLRGESKLQKATEASFQHFWRAIAD